MKRILAIAVVAVAVLMLVRCDELVGDRPTNVELSAATDSTVKVTWTAPAGSAPDKYVVKFKETGTATFVTLDDNVTATEYTHDPAGKTGNYMVAAMFGSTEYEALSAPTSAPITTAATSVSELNAAGNSGYGWSTSTGAGATYTMTDAGNAANVDFYITNFLAGYSGTPYSIASPDMGPNDPGGVVPTGSWKVNAFSNPVLDDQAPLPKYNQGVNYFNYTDIATDPTFVGCHTAAGYYALVKLAGVNTGDGTVQVTTYFQLVEGLRLVQH